MRITLKEKGYQFSKNWHQQYVLTYTQPIHRAIIAWFYHYIWENVSWRFFSFLIDDTLDQQARCYYLDHKDRVEIKTEYGEMIYEPLPKSSDL
jgi:hypothetical protein